MAHEDSIKLMSKYSCVVEESVPIIINKPFNVTFQTLRVCPQCRLILRRHKDSLDHSY